MTLKIVWDIKYFYDDKEIDMSNITDDDYNSFKREVVKSVIDGLESMRGKNIIITNKDVT